jgi:hypothetical protein
MRQTVEHCPLFSNYQARTRVSLVHQTPDFAIDQLRRVLRIGARPSAAVASSLVRLTEGRNAQSRAHAVLGHHPPGPVVVTLHLMTQTLIEGLFRDRHEHRLGRIHRQHLT